MQQSKWTRAAVRTNTASRTRRSVPHGPRRTDLEAPSGLGVTPLGPARSIKCAERKQQQHAYLPAPPARTQNTHVGREDQRLRPQARAAHTLTAANVTLVNGDAAAVSITVHQRILSPASLVGTHAATSDHFPHAAPI